MSRSTERSFSSEPLPSELLDGRYRLEALIGRGGAGVVYRALDTRLDRLVAVKALRDSAGADESRFRAEVRTLARFVHPNLVRLLDAGEFGGQPYLVMDLISGSTLAKRLLAGHLSNEETARVGVGIASALAYVHAAGVVHRDVKPANVLLDHAGTAHLADFGIARLVDTTGLTATGFTIGTPAYLAPEQIQGTAVTPATDIYALGLVLLECLTGQRAFEGTPTEVAGARLGRDPMMPVELDSRWRTVLVAMTAHDPASRLTAPEVAAGLAALPSEPDLTQALPVSAVTSGDTTVIVQEVDPGDTATLLQAKTSLQPTMAVPAVLDEKPAHPTRKVRRVALIGALSLVAIALALGFYLRDFHHSPVAQRGNRTDLRVATTPTTPPTSTSTSSTTTTSTTTTSTTVPIPTVTSAAGSLQSALQSGSADGNVPAPVAQQLDDELQPLLFASSDDQSQQQIQQFDQLVQTFDNDVTNGMITDTSTISALTSGFNTLATALGTTVPTTTTVPPTPVTVGQPGSPSGGGFGGGPGNGHGHGH